MTLVLPDANFNMTRDSDVEHAALAGHDVNVIGFLHAEIFPWMETTVCARCVSVSVLRWISPVGFGGNFLKIDCHSEVGLEGGRQRDLTMGMNQHGRKLGRTMRPNERSHTAFGTASRR